MDSAIFLACFPFILGLENIASIKNDASVGSNVLDNKAKPPLLPLSIS